MDANVFILPQNKRCGAANDASLGCSACFSRCRNGERGPVALGCVGDSAAVAHLLTQGCAMGLPRGPEGTA